MEHVDVLIVGAGLSGIGAAYRLQTEHPGRTYAILESRDAIGGTWDLFRYPGIRSDSDMFTLGYPFRPWTGAKAIADGGSILQYVRDTAAEFDIERHIRFGRRVVSAAWSSADARWSVEVAVGGDVERYRCSFLYLCSGYYSYERGHTPDIPGLADFAGPVVLPQFWPEDLDVTGKRVVVVGSGATAVTLVPALAPDAVHVTMLQRSPSWITVLPGTDAVADVLRSRLPQGLAHRAVRWKNILLTQGFYQLCQRRPELAKKLLRAGVARQLTDPASVDVDFAPRYDPWDQRLCVVPDADLFRALRSGRASVVTERISSVTATGVVLRSGRVLDADVLVTATGLELVACGGIALSVDGVAVDPGETVVYRGCLLSGVPNLAMCVGYTNASWTLRADLASRYVCRLLAHMDARGVTSAVPRPAGPVGIRPLLDLSSGYVQRAAARMPKQGERAPWLLRQNYVLDLISMRFGDPSRDMEFGLTREIDGLRVREPAAGN